jgi:hypothetical protein
MRTDRAAGTLTTLCSQGPHRSGTVLRRLRAHELRGEITLQLALAEAALDDPNADTDALRHGRRRRLRIKIDFPTATGAPVAR